MSSELDILKASHTFLRDDDQRQDSTWNDQLAAKFYSNLYREFAVCDLKHYKSGNFALRWRTEDEVLSGAGETTCGNTRCEHHSSSSSSSSSSNVPVPLTTLELPFAYVEHGENKSALVKTVLCSRCLKKLMWKKNKEKEGEGHDGVSALDQDTDKAGKRKRKRDPDAGAAEKPRQRRDRSKKRRHSRSPSHSKDHVQ